MGTKRKTGGGRGLIILVVVGVILLLAIPLLAVGGYVAWRLMAPGVGPGIGIPGLGGPRDRLVGKWETGPQQPANSGLPKVWKVIYEFKSDGSFTSTLDQGTGLPNPADTATWEVKSESGKVLKLHMRPPLTESQRKNFGDELNTYDLDVEILSDNQIRVTSFKSMAAVRVFDRKR